MKTVLLYLCLFAGSIHSEAQDALPAYPVILGNFFSEYKISNNYDSSFNLAKKKDGWYVQVINRMDNDRVLYEKIYWSVSTQDYEAPGELFLRQTDPAEAEKNTSNYLGPDSYNRWYDYERCRYFGYTGWEEDMIRDFADKEIANDTLLEGLARAYTFKSHSYLWYQSGGSVRNPDSLQVKLDRLQKPSAARVEKVVYYVNKAIDTYRRLAGLNPAYITLVGNVSVRQFIEVLYAWSQMKMCGENEKAETFLQRATLDQHYIDQAKNYLNSCEPNAILFTYGDNDTYQLWYVQEKLNYRKDITVINISLLGFAPYVELLKNKMVDFTAPASFYGNRDADVSYFQQNAKEPVKTNVTVNALLAALYSGKNKFTAPELTAAEPAYNAYSAETATIFVDAAKFNQHSALKTAARKITVKTGSYMMISDVLVLDIANTNINKCPVYFTTDYGTKFFDNSLLQQGIVYRLFPLNNANRSATTAQEAKALEQFATKLYQPVIDFKLGETRYHSPDGSNVFFSLYARILEYYQHHGNTVKIKYWLKKLNGIAPDLTIDHMPFANQLFYIYNQYDRRQLEKDVETYAEWLFKKATEYSAISGYLSREECIRNLEWLINSGWASNMDERAVRRMLKALGKND